MGNALLAASDNVTPGVLVANEAIKQLAHIQVGGVRIHHRSAYLAMVGPERSELRFFLGACLPDEVMAPCECRRIVEGIAVGSLRMDNFRPGIAVFLDRPFQSTGMTLPL